MVLCMNNFMLLHNIIKKFNLIKFKSKILLNCTNVIELQLSC